MLLLCLTGLPLIFSHEIDHVLGYGVELPQLPNPKARANVDDIIADAHKRLPKQAVQFLVAEPDEPAVWFVRMGETVNSPNLSAFYRYDARSGQFLNAYPLQQGIMNSVLRLHVDLFAGLPGMLFLGLMGILLALSLLSGTVLYGYYMRKLNFGTVRQQQSNRVKWLDLHNLLGIVTLVWFFTVGITGVINTLATPIFNRWQATELAAMTAAYRNQLPLSKTVSVQQVLTELTEAEPAMKLSFMAFPGNSFASPHHFVAFMQGNAPLTSTLLTPILIDAQNGRVIEKRELPLYVKALLLSQPLHFGDYGGLPLKFIWAVLDIICIVVLVSGVYLWLKKHDVSFTT
jgi:uncharacterized iron-regulated membrane protein